MPRRRRSTWKKLTLLALFAAGATGTVAIADTSGSLSAGALALYSFALDLPPAPDLTGPQTPATAVFTAAPVERCTRYESLRIAAAQGMRQGRVEEAGPYMQVIGRVGGDAVRMTIEGAADRCRILRVDAL
jgi:hypothetical protein